MQVILLIPLVPGFQEVLEQFSVEYMAARNLASGTRKMYRIDLRQFFERMQKLGLQRIEQVESKHIESFLAQLDRQSLAAATRRRKLSAIKTLFTWLRVNDAVPMDPTNRIIPIQWQTKPPRVLTKPEYQHLLSVIEDIRDRALLELILQTGIRLAEAHRLNLADIEIHDQVTAQTIGVMRVIGRGGKVRSLLLNTKACQALHDWLGERPLVATDALFVSRREKRLSRRQMQNLIEKYVKQAGLTNVSLHSLRHTFATHHLMMGTDIELVKEFLGHEWLRTTEVYEGLAESLKRIHTIQEHVL